MWFESEAAIQICCSKLLMKVTVLCASGTQTREYGPSRLKTAVVVNIAPLPSLNIPYIFPKYLPYIFPCVFLNYGVNRKQILIAKPAKCGLNNQVIRIFCLFYVCSTFCYLLWFLDLNNKSVNLTGLCSTLDIQEKLLFSGKKHMISQITSSFA